ncbi:MAG: TIGR04211 family SH3 domain-containing protein [Desulfobacterales bacterium]|nr:TIGR04211 family SH3 domain-containing protein [Desulfobacterales bacterium]
MRLLAIVLVIILSGAGLAQAETRYVTDSLEITLRTGPQLDRKITAMLKSGQSMEIIEKGEEWSQVRLPSGREGWVLNRFIKAKIPTHIQLETLRKKYDALMAGAAAPLKKLKKVEEENTRLRADLKNTKRDLGELQKSYKELRETTADARRIKKERDQLSKEVIDKSKETRRLKTDLAAAEKKNTLWGFIAGAGVLIFGFILGFAVRPRRKRSSLY